MKMAFKIFVRDLKRLIHTPLALIVIFGMSFMPSLYAWYCIEANWDPYANTAALSVAVANEDTGADNKFTGHLDVGDQVIDQLHENHQLGWTFVNSKQEALDKVYSGECYAAIIIPADFSKDFTSVFEGNYTQPAIEYYVNEKPSAVAPKITDTGATTLDTQINSAFISTVSETVVGILKQAGISLDDNAHNVDGRLTESISLANSTLAGVYESLDNLNPALDASKDTIVTAQGTLDTLIAQIPLLSSEINKASQTLIKIRQDTNTYASEVTTAIGTGATQLGLASAQANTAIGTLTGDLLRTQGQVDTALAELQQLIDTNNQIIEQLKPAAQTNPDIAAIITQLETNNASYARTIESLQALNKELETTITTANQSSQDINAAIQDATSNITQAQSTITTQILPQLSASLDSFAQALGSLSGAINSLTPTLYQVKDIMGQLVATIDQAHNSLGLAQSSLGAMQQNLERTLTDLRSLNNSLSMQDVQKVLGLNADEIASFMGSPVTLDTHVIDPIKNYGSGVTPFYTNLALWVAGFILVAILKVRVDPTGLPKFNAAQGYMGRWLLFISVALAQGFIACVGDLILGIQCASPVAFIAAGLLTVFVNVNLIYALAYAFKHIGKAIAAILLIFQIPGSSGMYPVEMMPAFFQFIHPLLPFTYSIDAMREAIGGMYGMQYWADLACLALFIPLGFFVGLIIGRAAINLNILFDRKLAETDLLLAEPAHINLSDEHFRPRTVLKALLDTDAFKEEIVSRAERFKRYYPTLIKAGWIAIFAQPAIMFILLATVPSDIETKIVLLLIMLGTIILVDTYLIVVEYLNENLSYQLQLSWLPNETLVERARAKLHTKAQKRIFHDRLADIRARARDLDQETEHHNRKEDED